MEKIIVLGTGAGLTANCYSTCFLLQNEDKYLLVDTGSGAQIKKQLNDVGVKFSQIHDLFISHKHIDHLLGIFCVIRIICQDMCLGKYDGILNIYCDKEIKGIVDRFIEDTFHKVHVDKYKECIIFNELNDGDELDVIGYKLKAINLYSREDKQFGFQTVLNNGKKLSFLGDVPCSEKNIDKIENTDWVLHEVFCLEDEAPVFKPHEKEHSTVKDVAEKMQILNIKNLVLWHTMDNNISERKKLYTEEAKKYFDGNVYVPNDLDIIEL